MLLVLPFAALRPGASGWREPRGELTAFGATVMESDLEKVLRGPETAWMGDEHAQPRP